MSGVGFQNNFELAGKQLSTTAARGIGPSLSEALQNSQQPHQQQPASEDSAPNAESPSLQPEA